MATPERSINDEDSDSGSISGSSLPLIDTSSSEETANDLNRTALKDKNLPETMSSSFNPRTYQLEMREESLKRNIIVAMDTGSGKTHIAVLRIIDELNRSPPEMIVWFLAPSVDLCIQQHRLLELEIPWIQIKILQGNDGVEKWKDKRIWDSLLKTFRVVVSTPQVLLDALTHGYIRLFTLSLIVFDEAHNCIGNSPTAKIMRDFYHRTKAQGQQVPHILGLSASPIMKSKQSPIEIEEALDAICRTPKIHREEMMRYVNMPEIRQVLYTEGQLLHSFQVFPPALRSLHKAHSEYNIWNDPYTLHLQAENGYGNKKKLDKLKLNRKTWCYSQLESLYSTSLVIFQELGAWAADYYIAQTVSKFIHLTYARAHNLLECQEKEKYHLYHLLNGLDIDLSMVNISSKTPGAPFRISDKVQQLITAILQPTDKKVSGIVFVQQRATAVVLHALLSIHPSMILHSRIGTVLGSSNNSYRNSLLRNLIEPPFTSYGATLDQFRRGELDLVIATSVLEEGIDIPACNVVICFDAPTNLKSFVQRRGRARMKESILVLMQEHTSNKVEEWQQLEQEMKKIYADDMRKLKQIEELEDTMEADDSRQFLVESTGALLTLDNAVSHLHHFCALLPQGGYVDTRPVFLFPDDKPARVILPLSVASLVREAQAKKLWLTERNAKKDVAFEAYLALHNAGLVNEHLVPLMKSRSDDDELDTLEEKRPGHMDVNAGLNPWIEVANEWNRLMDFKYIRMSTVTIKGTEGEVLSEMNMFLPVEIPAIPEIKVYWDENYELLISIKATNLLDLVGPEDIERAQTETWTMLNALHGWQSLIPQSPFVILFSRPSLKMHSQLSPSQIQLSQLRPKVDLIRDANEIDRIYVFEQWLESKPPATLIHHLYRGFDEVPTDMAHVALLKVPKRKDFLHRVLAGNQQRLKKHFSYVLPETRCIVGDISYPVVQFAKLIPSIMHRLEVYMLAANLANTVLAEVKFSNLHLVLTAVSASSAKEATNYQRLEFLGDSLLKIYTSIQLLAEYPLWPEGYLSRRKDQIVSNSRLAKAATHAGLDRFIITKSFTGRKWKPPYLESLINAAQADTKRGVSTKVLADIVEALIGAAHIEGGMSMVLPCLGVFLPEVDWQSLETRRASLFEQALADIALPPPLEPLERLIGYSFKKKTLLVEAMTHGSFSSGTASLERLEFLGDALLDKLIVDIIYDQVVELSHVQMHHLRTAFVNADFLAFVCMEWAIEQETCSIVEDKTTHTFLPSTGTTSVALWRFMRYSSQAIARQQVESARRFLELREGINGALQSGSHYPWALLCKLEAPKFFSDIVESLLGAVYIDAGSLDTCQEVIERMGILLHLRRAIRDQVHNLHPKEELGILANSEKVKYVTGIERVIVDGREHVNYTCEVFVGESSVVDVSDGLNPKEVKTKAAEAAVQILKKRSDPHIKARTQEGRRVIIDDAMDPT